MSSHQAPFALRLYRYKSQNALPFFNGQCGKTVGKWKETWLALHQDDTLIWYNDKRCTKICGRLRNFSTLHMPYLKAGYVDERDQSDHPNPSRPTFASPDEYLYLNIPKCNAKKTSPSYWFYTKCESDLVTCLRNFAKAAKKDGEFRQLLEEYRRWEDSAYRQKLKYKYGSSMKGDSNFVLPLKEDIGLIWQRFTNQCNGKMNAGYMPNGINTSDILNSLDKAKSDLDKGYCSSGTTATESPYLSCREECSDSEISNERDASSYKTTISVEIHPF